MNKKKKGGGEIESEGEMCVFFSRYSSSSQRGRGGEGGRERGSDFKKSDMGGGIAESKEVGCNVGRGRASER